MTDNLPTRRDLMRGLAVAGASAVRLGNDYSAKIERGNAERLFPRFKV